MKKKFYSVPEVAVMLGKSRQQVSLDCRLGKITSDKFGRSYYIWYDIVQDLLTEKLVQDKKKESTTIY